jgi:hypothetical protein
MSRVFSIHTAADFANKSTKHSPDRVEEYYMATLQDKENVTLFITIRTINTHFTWSPSVDFQWKKKEGGRFCYTKLH